MKATVLDVYVKTDKSGKVVDIVQLVVAFPELRVVKKLDFFLKDTITKTGKRIPNVKMVMGFLTGLRDQEAIKYEPTQGYTKEQIDYMVLVEGRDPKEFEVDYTKEFIDAFKQLQKQQEIELYEDGYGRMRTKPIDVVTEGGIVDVENTGIENL